MKKSVYGIALAVVAVSCSSAVAQCCNSQNVVYFDQAPVAWDAGYMIEEPTVIEPSFVDYTWSQPTFVEMPIEVENVWVAGSTSYDAPVYYGTSAYFAPTIDSCVCECGSMVDNNNFIIDDGEMAVEDAGDATTFESPVVENVIEGEVLESTFTSTADSANTPVDEAIIDAPASEVIQDEVIEVLEDSENADVVDEVIQDGIQVDEEVGDLVEENNQ